MKRFLALLLLLPSLVFAQSSPNWPLGYQPSVEEWNAEWASKRDYTPTPIPPPGTAILYATDYGVLANGVTSDDLQLKNAIDACAALGTRLYLPPGKILLTGTATSTLRNCAVYGSGVGAGMTTDPSLGTTFLLTSTTVKPFVCQSSWRLSSVNFYWPNQINGVTVYPPAISDDGSTNCSHVTIDSVNVVNAYDFVKQSGAGYGDWKAYNITGYAVHDFLQLNNLGDSFAFSVLRMTPGSWLTICGGAASCASTVKGAIDTASLLNSFLHVTSGPAVTVVIGQMETEAWRYGVLIDSGGALSGSIIDAAWDGTGTLIDASSGGHYNPGNIFRGSNTICSHAIFNGGPDQGSTPCFNMGANSYLDLNGFTVSAPRGDFATLSGGTLNMRNSTVTNVGSHIVNVPGDTTDYYLVHVTGTSTAVVNLQNNVVSGTVADTHVHGVFTGTNVPLAMTVQGTVFSNFNDEIDIQSGSNQPTSITNNVSQSTTGSASVTIRGANQVIHSGNAWNKPPKASIAACGTGTPTVTGAVSGVFTTGAGGVTSCAVTLPWVPYGSGSGGCVAMVSGTTFARGGPSGTPPTWTFTFSGATDNANVFFNCPSQQ